MPHLSLGDEFGHRPDGLLDRCVRVDADDADDATERSAPLIAICAGVLLNRMLLGNTVLNGPDTQRLIPYLHAALDAAAENPRP
ncbi:MAG TPA: hypothetical protein VFW65_33770 [Pseudonocardiaceae bacterium]|nr:hypothetical protein [Pseudonocardiaceae bacterium]